MTREGRRRAAIAAAGVAVAGLAVAAGFAASVPRSTGAAQATTAACTSSVHAYVLSNDGAVTLGYLPPGFRLRSGDPGDIGLGQGASPVYWERGESGAEIEVQPDTPTDPLGSSLLGASPYQYNKVPMTIGGHPGQLLVGLASNPITINSVEWRASPGTSVIVTGTLVDAAQVVEVARHLTFHAPVDITLPLTPGRIVSRAHATATASAGAGRAVAAKLTSFAEVGLLLDWAFGRSGSRVIGTDRPPFPALIGAAGTLPPPLLLSEPWRPIWAVLLAGPSNGLVLVDAATGKVEWTEYAGQDASWFGHLTDRAPGLSGCPGGSTPRIPFGVLTRTEEGSLGEPARTPPAGATETTTEKLVAMPAENALNAPLPCSGFCPLPSVDWVRMTVYAAAPGRTIHCPPPATAPFNEGPGPLVREYYTVSFREGGGQGCGGPPASYVDAEDLAPPA